MNGESRLPGNSQETLVSSGSSTALSQNAPDKPKWSGFVTLDSDIRVPKSVGVTLTAPTASGTLIAIASTSTPPGTPLTPETPIFGSLAQRPDGKQHRRLVISDPTMEGGEGRANGPSQEHPTSVFEGEAQKIGNGNGHGHGHGHGNEVQATEGQPPSVPFRETSLGAVITTVETYKEKHKSNYDELTEASMSETVDQIEKAFGFKDPEMIDSPRRVVTPNMGSLEREGSLGRRKKSAEKSPTNSVQDLERNGKKSASPANSLQDLEVSDGIRKKFGDKSFTEPLPEFPQKPKSHSGDSLPRQKNKKVNKSDASESILVRLVNEMSLESGPPAGLQSEEDARNNITTVLDVSRDKAEVKKEIRRRSEYEARVAARNLIIERLESHRQSLEGDEVEGLKIYHAKSRSTPTDVSKNRKSLATEKNPKSRHTSSQDDIPSRIRSPSSDDARKTQNSPRRKKPSEIPLPRSPNDSSRAKPVVRSERKINLSSTTSPTAEKSMTLPQYKAKRRHRQPSKQAAESDSSEETPRPSPRHRKSDSSGPRARMSTKKTASLPREHGASAIPRPTIESRAHRSHIPQLKGARITKLRVSASEEAEAASIVDQTTRLLSASQDIQYDQGASLVIAEDVLHSLTCTSDLLHSGTSREDKDKDRDRKDKSPAKIKLSGRDKVNLTCFVCPPRDQGFPFLEWPRPGDFPPSLPVEISQ